MIESLLSAGARAAGLLKQRGETVAVADGATGGLISAGLLTVPGGIQFYTGGGVIYSLRGRSLLLGLDEAELKGMRSVTEPYARLQARAIRDNFGAVWGVAETGASGGNPHPQGVPAGRSCIAVAGPGGLEEVRMIETGSDDRIGNMQAFATAALTFLADVLER